MTKIRARVYIYSHKTVRLLGVVLGTSAVFSMNFAYLTGELSNRQLLPQATAPVEVEYPIFQRRNIKLCDRTGCGMKFS